MKDDTRAIEKLAGAFTHKFEKRDLINESVELNIRWEIPLS